MLQNKIEKKKTVGQMIAEVNAQEDEHFWQNYWDFRPYNSNDLWKAINETVNIHKKFPVHENKDFYVDIAHIKEAGLRKPVNKIMTKIDCPTPVYAQSVFKYHHLTGTLEFLWTLPTKQSVDEIVANPGAYQFDKEYGRTPKFAILFARGDLDKWVDKENGNKINNVVIKLKKDEENG
jgi:hypothetical protein